MAEIDFPDPLVLNPWIDQNDKLWKHDGDGWVGVNIPVPFTGLKNVIINGRLGGVTVPWIINQRVFDGDWSALPVNVYGYDRWKNTDPGVKITQNINNSNLKENSNYVLSWKGGGEGSVSLLDVISPPSVSPVITSSGTNFSAASYMDVPPEAYDIQLELGLIQTGFEIRPKSLEHALCRHYFYSTYSAGDAPGTITDNGAVGGLPAPLRWTPSSARFQEEMSIIPNIIFYSPNTGAPGFVFNSPDSSDLPVVAPWGAGTSGMLGIELVDVPPADARITFHFTADSEI